VGVHAWGQARCPMVTRVRPGPPARCAEVHGRRGTSPPRYVRDGAPPCSRALERAVHCSVDMDSRARFALSFALAAVSACDDADARRSMPELDVSEAETSWYAANHAVAVAQTGLLERVEAGERADILVRCPGGGRMRLVGESNAAQDFQLDAMFEDCIDEGVMLGGDLTIVASVELEGDLPEDGGAATVFVDYQGRLRLDGDVEGACAIDAQVRAPALALDTYGVGQTVVEGTVCGHEAAAVVSGA
jgi:hypothetical protein